VVKPLSAALKGIGFYSGATVLGNGDLALILDPSAIALKAGVTMGGEEEAARAVEDEVADINKAAEFLLVEVAGRRAAVPLGDVLRIEQMPIKRVEYVGARPVINFEGQLLPVDDAGGVLAASSDNPETQIVVVVCREGDRHVGIAVSHVLDVATGAELYEAGTSLRTEGVTLLKECVTDIVNLGSVADLPGDSRVENQWSPAAEALL